ncbi:MAG: hypothetical protein IKE53_03355 [Clostridiales bacterium]|nr:hypothetical protein [Clostridiales bacterium]
MGFTDWHLAYMENNGYINTSHALNMKIANYLAGSGISIVTAVTFRQACMACDVDPESITASDVLEIQHRLKELAS